MLHSLLCAPSGVNQISLYTNYCLTIESLHLFKYHLRSASLPYSVFFFFGRFQHGIKELIKFCDKEHTGINYFLEPKKNVVSCYNLITSFSGCSFNSVDSYDF